MGQPEKPPTTAQLRYLKTLALRAGQSFTTPTTSQHASQEIRRLRAVKSNGFTFAEKETESHSINDSSLHPASSFSRFEIKGYGSTATWSQRA